MRPVARRSAAFAAGPPRVEVPWGLRVLGVLPMWLSLPLAVGASLGLAFLIQQGVPGRLGYAALTLGLVVGIVSVVARRVADRYGT
jgi:hypothetical protein